VRDLCPRRRIWLLRTRKLRGTCQLREEVQQKKAIHSLRKHVREEAGPAMLSSVRKRRLWGSVMVLRAREMGVAAPVPQVIQEADNGTRHQRRKKFRPWQDAY